jgi:hypothetical protein
MFRQNDLVADIPGLNEDIGRADTVEGMIAIYTIILCELLENRDDFGYQSQQDHEAGLLSQ